VRRIGTRQARTLLLQSPSDKLKQKAIDLWDFDGGVRRGQNQSTVGFLDRFAFGGIYGSRRIAGKQSRQNHRRAESRKDLAAVAMASEQARARRSSGWRACCFLLAT
jgi:hypothetical protein